MSVPSWVHARQRMHRPAMTAVALLFLALLVQDLASVAARWSEVGAGVGVDFYFYRDAAARWIDGGPFYLDFQLAGPYVVWGLPATLYPPTALLLFTPFTVLPPVTWWAIPIGIVVTIVAYHRPRPATWPVLAMCLWFPTTAEVVYAGNSVIWVVAAVALATVWHWPGLFVVLKPTLGPFALIGCWHRSWWVALAALVLISLPFGSMWLDYVTAVLNTRDPNGILYSLNQVPTVLIPVVAWLGSSHAPPFGLQPRSR